MNRFLTKTAICLCGLCMVFTACDDDDKETNESLSFEGGETVIEEKTLPLSDQMEVTTDNTVYLLNDNSLQSVRQVTIADNVLARFAQKQLLPDSVQNAAVIPGDCVMLDAGDINGIAADTALASGMNVLRDKGATFIIVQPTKEQIGTFLTSIGVEAPILGEPGANNHMEMYVYTYSPAENKSYASIFNDLTETFECTDSTGTTKTGTDNGSITEYIQGNEADAVLSDIIETENAGVSAAKAGTRGSSADINNYPSAWSLKFNDSFTTSKSDYYKNEITGGTDRFIYVFNIWPIHSDDTGDNFFYITLKNTLAFGPAYHDQYKKYIFPHGAKICEWAGYQFEWSFKSAAGGINPDDIITEEHSPKTTETSTTYTNGFSFNIGGSGSVGFQGDNPTGSLGFSAGLQVSNSATTTIPDVSYRDMTGSDDDSHVGGIFTIAEARANYATLNYGLVRVTDPALAARSTFAPDCAWVYRIKKGAAGKAIFDFNAKVTLRSYKGYSNGSSGKMTTKDKIKNFPATLDLSVYKFK